MSLVDELFTTLASASERIDLIHNLVSPQRKIVLWSQVDPTWKDVAIGSTTIGKFGCLMTCWAMMLSAILGRDVQPTEIAEKLKPVTHSNGGVMYEDVSKFYSDAVDFLGWLTTEKRTKEQLLSYANETDNKVYFRTIGVNTNFGTHYVLAIGDGLIADPIDGTVCNFKDRYSVDQIFEVATWKNKLRDI